MIDTSIGVHQMNVQYDTMLLKRTLPFVTKFDIEVEQNSHITKVNVHYTNGLIAKVKSYDRPSKTEDLIDIALAAAHQCLILTFGFEATFSYGNRVRAVWVEGECKYLSSDMEKLQGATPIGAPSFRDVQLSVPNLLCMPGESAISNGQVKPVLNRGSLSIDDQKVSVVERGRIRHDRVEKPRLDKKTAKRATDAMAELLKAVGIDGNQDSEEPKR